MLCLSVSILQLNRAIEQHPLHFHPYLHPWYCCHTGACCSGTVLLAALLQTAVQASSSQHSYCIFSEFISVSPPGSLDHVQISLSFFILTVWLAFAITTHCYNLCAMHNKKIFPIWVVCHGYWKSAVCSIPKSRKGRYLNCNWINITFSLKGTLTLTETTSNGDC